jgi:hypothetical protein
VSRRRRASFATLVAAVVLGACDRAPPIAPSPRWWEPAPTPTPAPTPLPTPTAERRCDIEILEAEPPRAFRLLGLVEVQPRGPAENEEAIVAAARLQACALGGDAIVVLFRSGKRRSGFQVRGAPQRILPEPAFRGAVIRYGD